VTVDKVIPLDHGLGHTPGCAPKAATLRRSQWVDNKHLTARRDQLSPAQTAAPPASVCCTANTTVDFVKIMSGRFCPWPVQP